MPEGFLPAFFCMDEMLDPDYCFFMKTRHFYLVVVLALTGYLPAAESVESSKIYLWPDRTDHLTEREMPDHSGGITRITDITRPSITVYSAKSSSPVPAVMVCPGGGYGILAINLEGTEIAEWLNSIGVTAVILKYTVPNNRNAALQDAQRAMGLIRFHSKEWNINPDQLGVIGFSAGGHLAACLSNNDHGRTYEPVDEADQLSSRPDFTMLIYPAYLGDANYKLSPEVKVTTNTPPAFIVQAQNDRKYINSSIAYYLALKKQNIPAELHLFPDGGHGFGLRPSDKDASHWPELAERWLKNPVLTPLK